jgi:DNA invertase Pin-like site-specific DNA recombinase
MLDDLREPGVKFQSVTEQIDTETPTGRAMWQMIGHARKLISEGETSKSVSAILRVSKATIYRAMP